jgi:hypothetical protein
MAAGIVAVLGASTVHAATHTVGWAAWRDTKENRLHVVGAVLAPHPGYVARLEPVAPQGFNPHQYLMDLVLEERPGPWPQVPTYVAVEYSEDRNDDLLTEVAVKSPDSLVAVVEMSKLPSTWRAWVEGDKRTLHVTGTVDAPDPGYQVKLKKAKSQDKKSGEYRLDLVLTPGKGMWTQVITPKPVSYTEKELKTAYARVAIRDPQGKVEVVPIERMR